MHKNPTDMTKKEREVKEWKDMNERKKTFSRVKCMNYTHKARQKWRWRVWLQSSQRWCLLTDCCVDENVNNGTYLSDLILKGQREKVQYDLFVVLLLSLTVIYFEKHTHVQWIIHCKYTELNLNKKYCGDTMVHWDLYHACSTKVQNDWSAA